MTRRGFKTENRFFQPQRSVYLVDDLYLWQGMQGAYNKNWQRNTGIAVLAGGLVMTYIFNLSRRLEQRCVRECVGIVRVNAWCSLVSPYTHDCVRTCCSIFEIIVANTHTRAFFPVL